MIPAKRPSHLQLNPRSNILGFPPPWKPAIPSALSAETALQCNPLIDVRRTEVGGFTLGQPQWSNTTSSSMQPATSIPIGMFDLVKIARPAPTNFKEPVCPSLGIRLPTASNANTEDNLSYRLAASLQPPIVLQDGSEEMLEWPAPLLSYQRDGVTALLSHKALLLADDMGLGKTIQTIAAVRILYYQHEIESALIVCPASLISQWRREFMKWAPGLHVISVMGAAHERGILWQLPAHVKLISYDTMRGDVLDLKDSPVLRKPWSVVILDEASRIKNRDTAVSIACKRIHADRRWALTGTPLENRRDDLISILEFLVGDIDRDRLRLCQNSPVVLRELLEEIQLRRRKHDVLHELPIKRVIEQIVELHPSQRKTYDLAEQKGIINLQRAGNAATISHVLELITRLKQICNNDPVTGQSSKLNNIEERIGVLTLEGHRALIFSQFTDAEFGVKMIADRLSRFAPLSYTGAQSAAQKASTVDQFINHSRHKALILSLRAGGVGLNLQTASYVFHLDRWWNPAIEEQADSRAHRMGQPLPVTVFRYICADTIEERIDAKLKAKRELFQELVDNVSLSDDINLAAALSERELFGLFGLSPGKQ